MLARVMGSKKLYCRMLDAMYKTLLVDPTEEKYLLWGPIKRDILEIIARNHAVEYQQLLGALESPDGVRSQKVINTKVLINACIKRLNASTD